MGVFCQHAGVCGGCSLLAHTYADQLKSKGASLGDRLKISPPAFEPVFPGNEMPQGFRQKVAFVFGRGLVMGHYARGSRSIVPIRECPVHSARGNRIAFALRDELVRCRIEPGILRHLLVRTSQDDRQAIAMLVVTHNDKSLRRPVRAFLETKEKPDGFFININDDPGPFMVGPETIRIAGKRHVVEKIDGLSFLVSPNAFFQTNVLAAASIQRQVVAGVGEGRVLDLYCGSGLFSLAIARHAKRVVAIEENGQAIRDAEGNAKLNRIPAERLRFLRARVEDGLERVSRDNWDAVVLDPPRQGCSRDVLAGVFERIRPARGVYVSCNPEALAGELPSILKAGYQVDEVRPVDMFPHTDHIETVVRLSRRLS